MSATEVLSETAAASHSCGSRSTCSTEATAASAAVTVGSLTRLVLPKKCLLVNHKACLPSGDCLPSWHQLPLYHKLPMYRVPKGALDLTVRRLSQPTYINRRKVAFDLTDPNNHSIDNNYNSLNDPHLKKYYRSKIVKKYLVEKGLVTSNDLVKLTLKEFNKYRSWLTHVGLLEFRHQQEEERKKEAALKNLSCEDTMDVVSVETRIHHELVRQRQAKHHEAQQLRRRSQIFELDRRMEVTRQMREDKRALDNALTQQRRQHRQQVYDKASKMYQRRTRQMKTNLKRRMKKHDDHLKELEASKEDDSAKKVRDEWERRKAYQNLLQEEVKNAYQMEADRSKRYQKLFIAEMSKRWQAQTAALQARAQEARRNRRNCEEGNSRHLAHTLASSPLLNPQQFRAALPAPPPHKVPEEAAADSQMDLKTSPPDANQQQQQQREDFCQSFVGSPTVGGPADSSVRIPSFTTVFFDKSLVTEDKPHALALEAPLEEMGLNVRLHPLKESITFESSTDSSSDLPSESEQDLCILAWEAMTPLEREELEDVLHRLLSDLNSGRLDQDDLVRLAACCAFLNEVQLTEQATSTTSLALPTDADETDEGASKEDSVSSISLDRFVREAMGSAMEEQDRRDEELSNQIVDDTIRATVARLTRDLQDGTLSREEVREIGSAVASAVVGEVRSDVSVIAEEAMVPTLQQLLREVEQIDEALLDQTLASLLLSYHQVTRRLDKLVWEVIKDFAVEVMLRTKVALVHGDLDPEQFLANMESCKKTPLQKEMELPDPQELIFVLSTATQKLQRVKELCPVLCDLTKLILDIGKPLLVQRDGADAFSLPDINSVAMEKIGETACGLEVALEVAATVADGLDRDMQMDRDFEELLRLSLAPSFFLTLLACWGEMTAAVPKETVALQTSHIDLPYMPTLGEYLVLIACQRLFNDAAQDRLPCEVITHLALHVAEFPGLVSLSAVLNPDETGRVKLPLYVLRKISTLGLMIQDRELEMEEMEKLLAVLLHIYFREVLMPLGSDPKQPDPEVDPPEPDSAVPAIALEEEEEARAGVTFLVRTLATMMLHHVQNEVVMKLDANAPEQSADVSVPWEVVQLMSDRGLKELKDQMRKGLTTEHLQDQQLKHLMAISTLKEHSSQKSGPLNLETFMTRVMTGAQKVPSGPRIQELEEEEFRTVRSQFRKQLGSMARDVIKLFAGMSVLHKNALQTSPAQEKMVSFLVALLRELRQALQDDVISADVISDFLHAVAGELCPLGMARDDKGKMVGVILDMVNDIEWRGRGSRYFGRLVTNLSQVSLDPSQQTREVAEGMATTAHMLSGISPAILGQFVQTTLLSLLHSMRGSNTRLMSVTPVEPNSVADETEGTPDAANNNHVAAQINADIKKGSGLCQMPPCGAAADDAKDAATDDAKDAEDAKDAAADDAKDAATDDAKDAEDAKDAAADDAKDVATDDAEDAKDAAADDAKDAAADDAKDAADDDAKDAAADDARDAEVTGPQEPCKPENHETSPPEDLQDQQDCGTEGQAPGTESPVSQKDGGCQTGDRDQGTSTVTDNSKPKAEEGAGGPISAVATPQGSRTSIHKTSLPGSKRASSWVACSVGDEQAVVLDKESQVEIFHETDIIAHIAIQNTLELLGALVETRESVTHASGNPSPCLTPHPSQVQVDQIVDILVTDFDNVAGKAKPVPAPDFTDLHPAMVPYAQRLMQHVTECMGTEDEEEEEGGRGLEAEDMAAIIISDTLKSLQDSGTSVSKPQDKANEGQSGMLGVHNLKACLTTTLTAVHSELDLRQASASTTQPGSDSLSIASVDVTGSTDALTLKRAYHIVEFLLDRVQKMPTWDPKVELGCDRKTPTASETNVWQSHSGLLSDNILQTFRDVLHDMHKQNKFFSHSELGKILGEGSTILLPSLPYLLDEYILSHLQVMALLLTRHVPGMESPHRMLSTEAHAVATNFHTVLKDALLSARSSEEEDGSMDKVGGKKLFVLTVLDKAITRILEDTACMTLDSMITIEEAEEASWRRPSNEEEGSGNRTKVEVKNDLKRLLASLGNMRTASEHRLDSTEDARAETQRVTKAIQQIMDSLQEDKVSDDVLNDLCHTLLPRPLQDESREGKRTSLVMELRSMVLALQSGQISPTKLAQAAADIDAMETRQIEDPRRVAGVIQKVSSSLLQRSSTQYLKMALEDLLLGLGERSRESTAAAPQPDIQRGSETLAAPRTQLPDQDAENGETRPGRPECPTLKEDAPSGCKEQEDTGTSISSRTISKIDVSDDSDNRLKTSSLVYSSVIHLDAPSSSTKPSSFTAIKKSRCEDQTLSRRTSAPVVSFDQMDIDKLEPSPGDVTSNRNVDDPPDPDSNQSGSDHKLGTPFYPSPSLASAHENLCEEKTATRIKVRASVDATHSDTTVDGGPETRGSLIPKPSPLEEDGDERAQSDSLSWLPPSDLPEAGIFLGRMSSYPGRGRHASLSLPIRVGEPSTSRPRAFSDVPSSCVDGRFPLGLLAAADSAKSTVAKKDAEEEEGGKGREQEGRTSSSDGSSNKRTGSRGSEEDRHKDWNRSAIRIRSEHYVRCDDVLEDEPSRRDPGSLRVQDSTEDFKLMTKQKVSRNCPKKPFDPVSYSRQLMLKSKAFAVAAYCQSPYSPGKGSKTSQKNKSKLKKENCSELRNLPLEPTTAVQEYGNRPHSLSPEDTELSDPSQEMAPEITHSAQGQAQQENVSVKKQTSVSPSKQKQKGDKCKNETDSSADVNLTMSKKPNSSADVNLTMSKKPKLEKQSNEIKTTTKPSAKQEGDPSRGKPSCRRKALLPEERILRAQMKAFALGLSLFNAEEKGKLMQAQKRKETQQLLAAKEDASVQHPSAQPLHRVGLSGHSRASDPWSSDSPCSCHAAHRSTTSSSQSLFAPHPPFQNKACSSERDLEELRTMYASKRKKNVKKRKSEQQAETEVPDSVVQPTSTSRQTAPRGESRAADKIALASSPPLKPKPPEGRFLRKLMEWNSDSPSSGPATQTNVSNLNIMRTPERIDLPSSKTTESGRLLEGTQTQTDEGWPGKESEAQCSVSDKSPSTSVSIVPLQRSSHRLVVSDFHPKQSVPDKLPTLTRKGPAVSGARTAPSAQPQKSLTISSQTLSPILRGRVDRSSRDRQRNAMPESSSSRLQPRTQSSSALQSLQNSPGGSFMIPHAPDSERMHPVPSRRRVRLLLGGSFQIPGVPTPTIPRPPDFK